MSDTKDDTPMDPELLSAQREKAIEAIEALRASIIAPMDDELFAKRREEIIECIEALEAIVSAAVDSERLSTAQEVIVDTIACIKTIAHCLMDMQLSISKKAEEAIERMGATGTVLSRWLDPELLSKEREDVMKTLGSFATTMPVPIDAELVSKGRKAVNESIQSLKALTRVETELIWPARAVAIKCLEILRALVLAPMDPELFSKAREELKNHVAATTGLAAAPLMSEMFSGVAEEVVKSAEALRTLAFAPMNSELLSTAREAATKYGEACKALGIASTDPQLLQDRCEEVVNCGRALTALVFATVDPVLLSTAHGALIECIEALRALAVAAVKQDASDPRDYRPFLARLYESFRKGWDPIYRCWPILLVKDREVLWQDHVAIDRKCPDPADLWLLARNAFWQIVWDTEYRGIACVTWNVWSDDISLSQFDADISGYQHPAESETLTWARIRSICSVWSKAEFWEHVVPVINEIPPHAWACFFSTAEGPWRPFIEIVPPKPLPTERRGLERLLHETNELIAFHSSLASECTSFASEISKPLAMDVMFEMKVTQGLSLRKRAPQGEASKCVRQVGLGVCEYDIAYYDTYLMQLTLFPKSWQKNRTWFDWLRLATRQGQREHNEEVSPLCQQ